MIFFQTEISKFVCLLKLTLKEVKEYDNSRIFYHQWNTDIPMLRFMHALMKEDIKILFHLQNLPMN
jgi:hypothetical protein